MFCTWQGEIGEPGQKGSKGDKGEQVSVMDVICGCFLAERVVMSHNLLQAENGVILISSLCLLLCFVKYTDSVKMKVPAEVSFSSSSLEMFPSHLYTM